MKSSTIECLVAVYIKTMKCITKILSILIDLIVTICDKYFVYSVLLQQH